MYNVLVLYNGQSMYTPTVQDYLEAFRRHSANNIHFLHVDGTSKPAFSFDDYDVLLITYSCRLCYLESMSPLVRSAIVKFRGLKVAFPQDEYQETNKLRDGIRELGIKLVFTCVPEDKIAWVYPPAMLPGVRFRRVLTGYVPQRLALIPRHKLPPMQARPSWIGYRGRHLGHFWGDLSFYKSEIGRRFKSTCEHRKVPHDIAWTEEARIYQERWYGFMLSCRATLATPSGCNIFDWDGSMEREYKEIIRTQPHITYEAYRPRIAHREAEIDMGQVSPRMFEAAALGTALIVLEGSYSGVVQPGIDCLTVRRDFSNIDDVLDELGDVGRIAEIADRAYESMIASGRWSYDKFVALVDEEIEAVLEAGAPASIVDGASLRRVKSAEQSLLETMALAAPDQFALTRWLDLSHLRDKSSRHGALTEAVGHFVGIPKAPAVTPAQIDETAAGVDRDAVGWVVRKLRKCVHLWRAEGLGSLLRVGRERLRALQAATWR